LVWFLSTFLSRAAARCTSLKTAREQADNKKAYYAVLAKSKLAEVIKGVVFGRPPECGILTGKSIPQFLKSDAQSFQPVLMVNHPGELVG
jgi:hypothetical protein